MHFSKKTFEVFSAFTKFKALIKKENDCDVKVTRFDREDKFIVKEFEEYSENNRIHPPLIVSYSLQKNK